MDMLSINGVVQSEFAYNALGQQVIRRLTVGGQTIHSVHDADGNRIAEYDYDPATQISTLLREYVWMNGENVAVIEGGNINYIRTDHIGRPVFATNDLGVKVWEASYLPFGGVHTSTGTASDLRFPGQWFQAEAGLHQNWMRDYDPTTGRYIQADPLGLVDGASVYNYASLNPSRYIDPRGEQSQEGGGMPRSICEILGGCGRNKDAGSCPKDDGFFIPLPGMPGTGLPGYSEPDELLPPVVTDKAEGDETPEPPFPYPHGWDGTTPPAPGWKWEGPDAPGGERGGWVSPDGETSISPDFDHEGDIGPHIDLNNKNPKRRHRWYPDGTIEPK